MFKLGLIISILLTIPGELIRVPVGPGNGLLLNDIFLPFLVIFWLLHKIAASRTFPRPKAIIPLIIFIGIAAISLLNSFTFLESKEILEGSFYLIRFIEYSFLYIITIDIVRVRKDINQLTRAIIFTTVALATCGFIQLKIYPDFRAMEDLGWDPHVNRLLSTWFDPNFIGGLFAFISSILTGIVLTTKRHKTILSILLIIIITALFFTYSRSSYLALATGIFTIGALKSRKFLATVIIAAILIIPLSERAQTRIINMYHSAKSLITDTAETPDITVQHRINSWKRAIQVYQTHPFLGTGYNTFKFVQSREGLIMDINSHASTGSDSSLLTILATTGPIGLFSFLAILITFLKTNLKARKNGLQLGTLGGLAALFVHSIFVNSLLFPNIMVFFLIMNGLSEAPRPCQTICPSPS